MSAQLQRILAVRLVTHEPERLARFYAEALGAQVGPAVPIPAEEAALVGAGVRRTLTLGTGRLDLDAFDQPGAPYPPDVAAEDSRFQHVALVTADIGAALEHAQACGASLISRGGAVVLPASSGGVTAVKLRDPEGHPFELLALPPGGPWDAVAPNARAIRGLDHSAITVRDAEASRCFYAGHGLAARGATLNQGPTQAALDGLDAPMVDVIPLFPPEPTPHLELLGYRGASYAVPPVGDRDVAATRIAWAADGAPRWLRDPDGHRHLLAAPSASVAG